MPETDDDLPRDRAQQPRRDVLDLGGERVPPRSSARLDRSEGRAAPDRSRDRPRERDEEGGGDAEPRSGDREGGRSDRWRERDERRGAAYDDRDAGSGRPRESARRAAYLGEDDDLRKEGRWRGGDDRYRGARDDDDRPGERRRSRPRDPEDERADERDDDRRDRRQGRDDEQGGKQGDDRQDEVGKRADKKDSDAKQGGDKQDDKKAQEQRRSRRPVMIGIASVLGVLLVAGGIYYWLSGRGKVDTDDAYTDGNVVNIAPQVSGQVIELDVNDNQFVHKGDVIVRIDPRQFQYSAEQSQGTLEAAKAQVTSQKLGVEIAKKNFPANLQLAKANLESAQAALALQKANNDRQKSLPKAATTQQDVDTTASQYQQAQAQVDQAQARVLQAEPVPQNIGQSEEQGKQYVGQADQAQGQLDQANLNIEWATVRAPQDGWITRRNVNAGNYIQAGTQIMSLVTTDVWVTANYKETELNGMRSGQRVAIKVDAYPDLDLRGHVDSIQRGSGSRFSTFPAENATGNFVKIVQRVPVKIVIDSGLRGDEPLPLGVSVVPTVMLQ